MDRSFINKNVEIMVAFSAGRHESGSLPTLYRGQLIASNQEYVKLLVTEKEVVVKDVLGTLREKEYGQMVIRKDYVVYIKEI